MPISSRTPEGDPNRCPICGNAVRLEPSLDTRDAPCPHCGHLLWFEPSNREGPNEVAKFVLQIATTRLGPPTDEERAAILGLDDISLPKSIMERALKAGNWQELIETV